MLTIPVTHWIYISFVLLKFALTSFCAQNLFVLKRVFNHMQFLIANCKLLINKSYFYPDIKTIQSKILYATTCKMHEQYIRVLIG